MGVSTRAKIRSRAEMIRSKSFFVALTSAVLAICSGEVLQCEPDKSKLCTAKCDGQEVDIATILPYPYMYVAYHRKH